MGALFAALLYFVLLALLTIASTNGPKTVDIAARCQLHQGVQQVATRSFFSLQRGKTIVVCKDGSIWGIK